MDEGRNETAEDDQVSNNLRQRESFVFQLVLCLIVLGMEY